MKSLNTYLTEKKVSVLGQDKVIPLSDITPKTATTAIANGHQDGTPSDDAANYKHVKIAVKNLKAAQTEIIPEKAIGMAIGMMLGEKLKIGGDLGSIISADNYIMDGHHRWAATYLCDPSASVEGTQIGLDGVPLVSVLNIITKGVHNRSGNPGKGNIKDFTGKVIGGILDDYLANGIGGQFPISADEIQTRLGRVPGANGDWTKGKQLMMKNADALPKKIMPGAPARIDMPVINPEEVKAAAEMIKRGDIDMTNPFSEETTKAIKECFVSAESSIYEGKSKTGFSGDDFWNEMQDSIGYDVDLDEVGDVIDHGSTLEFKSTSSKRYLGTAWEIISARTKSAKKNDRSITWKPSETHFDKEFVSENSNSDMAREDALQLIDHIKKVLKDEKKPINGSNIHSVLKSMDRVSAYEELMAFIKKNPKTLTESVVTEGLAMTKENNRIMCKVAAYIKQYGLSDQEQEVIFQNLVIGARNGGTDAYASAVMDRF